MPDNAEIDRIQLAKEMVLPSDGRPLGRQTAHLAESWRRSRTALGAPENITDVPQVSEELLDAHLLDLFREPLTRFSDSVAGTGLGVLLADSRGRILHRWCGDRTAAAHLDRIGTVRGAVLSEDSVGTNGVGTVAASGRSVQIRGGEHFAEFYRDAVCTGAPVRHPMTGSLLAVVTLSCDVTPRTDLLRPLLDSVTQRLEAQVLDMQQPAARRAFDTFLELSRVRTEPVVVFGSAGLLIQNSQSGRLVPEDLDRLQELCAEAKGPGRQVVELTTGPAMVHVTVVEPGNAVAVVEEQHSPARTHTVIAPPRRLIGRDPDWLATHREIERSRASATPVIVAGRSGAGKVSLALGRPVQQDAQTRGQVFDAAQRHVLGKREWLAELGRRLEAPGDLVVRGAQTLEPALLDGMRTLLEQTQRSRPVLVTLTADAREDAEAFGLKYAAPVVWVPALAERVGDLPALWRHFAASPGFFPDQECLELLKAYRWPGNLKELRTVIAQLGGGDGVVSPADLPPTIRAARSLTMIEQVELEAIRKALREANGNRAKAAQILGVSRATVYRKIKAYRLVS
ncbi:Transcriptional regulator of acetoin/glycerol metabolism [Prauserella marina]|uniref:Transcriptional regulator of acetoin/glycerol metabolism n=1 Tax=Prauserella marina TaxID=530584 RepID=A0A1G6IMC2_9PSEU|nr:helix-turn-helix domain-containing protein [Prauserella marina]PWV84981.1 transcriptional regulator of acetoin/glycerol metabolism [Prauserella marina]SDC07712.1 Transcriptional regulator of acetoin/glycerol metabolism [Prauserella marina]